MSSPTTRSKPPRGSKSKRKSPKTTKSRTPARPPGRQRLCVVALGSNLGPSERTFDQALRALRRLLGPLRVAPMYRSEPVSEVAQPDYLNTVAIARTSLSAESLLAALQAIERRFGRIRQDGEPAGAARTLDLDLLLLGRLSRRRRAPLLPHPRMRDRRFVLAPLADLEPGLPLPPDGATVGELLAALPDRPWVRRLGARPPRGHR